MRFMCKLLGHWWGRPNGMARVILYQVTGTYRTRICRWCGRKEVYRAGTGWKKW